MRRPTPTTLLLYEEMGRATSHWQEVEAGLGDVFSRAVALSLGGDIATAIPMLSRVLNVPFQVNTKLEMIDAVLADHVFENLRPDWDRLKRRVRNQASNRNVVAHGVAYGPAGGEVETLSNPFFTNRTRAVYDADNIHQFAISFAALSRDIRQFAVALNQALTSRSNSQP